MINNKQFLLAVLFLLMVLNSHSQTKHIKHLFYFSWGYNKEWYADNNIRINQPSLQNKYTFEKVKGVDKPGWNTGIFNKDLTIPQYNYRLGYRINKKWSAELNFDHTKYQVPDQTLHITGTYHRSTIDSSFARTGDNLTYQLNNGANFFLFNAVRLVNLLKTDSSKININLLLKGGIGFVYPHVENTIMSQKNNSGFQFGGFDAGTEAGIQITFFKYVYLEYTNKVVFSRYRNLQLYEGTAKQNLSCYEMIFSLGVWF
ncbi:MAG: hypothetical protein HY841_07140 [Bacteroidetes bacterium]|nr:hypothetical protein [Bacteroidota bacterium]